MSDATRAVLAAAVIGIAILLGPLTLLAAGVVGVGAMLAIQAAILLGLYAAAVVLKRRRDESG